MPPFTAVNATTVAYPTTCSATQLANARAIIAVVTAHPTSTCCKARSLPERAAIAAIDCALVESNLYNLPYGDGSSTSLYQQTNAWSGTAAQHQHHLATNSFLDALLRQSDWKTGKLGTVIYHM